MVWLRFQTMSTVSCNVNMASAPGAFLVHFYGASDDAVLPLVKRMKAHFGGSGKARYVSHEEASGNPILQIHIDMFSGRPTRTGLRSAHLASRRRERRLRACVVLR